ncbi:MAG: alpha-E domain-containing protein, partial [Thermostichus sp. DG_1_6_bins_120]
MLSRVADSIYWLNRYVERAENIARFIDVNLNLILDSPSGTTQQWEPIIYTTGDHELFYQRYGEATQDTVVEFLTFDKDYPNSILSCLKWARENARS